MSFRIVQIGLGNRGRTWADLIASHPDAELGAVVDIDPARLDAFAQRHPGPQCFAALDEALAAGPYDAALLATPPGDRLDQIRRIFAAGLPLLAEKPLATSLAEAASIVRLSEDCKLPLSVGLNFRYLPVTQAIRDLVTRQTYGKPGFGQFSYRRNRDGRRPGLNRYPLTMRHPMMLEQSVHHLDLIRFAYGREAVAVACRTWNPPWSMYAHAANVSCLLTLEDGLEVNYLGTWTGGWNALRFEWRTDCERGVIVQRSLFGDLATAGTRDADLTPVPLPEARPFIDDSATLMTDFIASIRAARAPPCGGRDHLRTLALCFAAIESDEAGRRVDLAEFSRRNRLEDLA